MLAGSCANCVVLVQRHRWRPYAQFYRERCGVGGPLECAASTPLILVCHSPGGVSTSLAGVAMQRCSSSRA
eukprot:1641232-Lingulodinium_polyedra.AAC.1